MTGATYSLLIVEDSPSMRQLVAVALARLRNVKVSEAADGVEALKFFNAKVPPDIVLLDINLPLMDGLKLLSHIRGDARLKHLPVVMVTTEGAAVDRQRALHLGADAYITKPIQGAHVVEVVRRLLKLP